MARMTDIMRADELKAAKDKLETWQKLDRAAKKAAYATAAAVGGGKRVNRGASLGYIQPFGAPDNFWYETKILAAPTAAATPNEEAAGALITAVITATAPFQVLTVPPGTNNIANLAKKVQFAKARCTEKSGAGIATTSRVTGLPYTKYASNTVSSPFGVGDGGAVNTEPTARTAIRTALMNGNPAGRSVGFSPQGFVGNVMKAPTS